MEEPCTCPRGPSRCTTSAHHRSHRLRSDQCVSARRNVKRGIWCAHPSSFLLSTPRRSLRCLAAHRYRGRRHCPHRTNLAGRNRRSCWARPRPSCGTRLRLRWFRSTRQSPRICTAPRTPGHSVAKQPMVSMQEQRASRCKGGAVLTSPIQTVPAPAALVRSSTCCCSAALVTVARCPPSLSQLASASYQVAGASKKVNSCPSSLSET